MTVTAADIAHAARIALQETTSQPEGWTSSTTLTLILIAAIGGAVVLGALWITQRSSGSE